MYNGLIIQTPALDEQFTYESTVSAVVRTIAFQLIFLTGCRENPVEDHLHRTGVVGPDEIKNLVSRTDARRIHKTHSITYRIYWTVSSGKTSRMWPKDRVTRVYLEYMKRWPLGRTFVWPGNRVSFLQQYRVPSVASARGHGPRTAKCQLLQYTSIVVWTSEDGRRRSWQCYKHISRGVWKQTSIK